VTIREFINCGESETESDHRNTRRVDFMGILTEGAARDVALQDGGSFGTDRNVQLHYVYDSRFIPAVICPTENIFFTTAIGGGYGGGVKSIAETNLYDSGKLPNGQAFTVKRMLVSLQSMLPIATTTPGAIVQAWNNIVQHSVFSIIIPPRSYELQCPGRCFVAAVPVMAAGAATIYTSRSGDSIASGWVSLGETPIVIGNLVSFQVSMVTSSAVAASVIILNANSALLNGINAEIGVTLEGTLTRNV
jgi:hypothetical protein